MNRRLTGMLLVVLAVGLALAPETGSAAEMRTVFGPGQQMGGGTVRSYAVLRPDGTPAALGISFKAALLDGLPPRPNRTSRCFDLDGNGRINDAGECEGDYERRLALPAGIAGRPDMPFKWVGLNWNPHGHPPPPWSVPHFDVHFYMVEPAEIDAIRVGPCEIFIHCDDRKRALVPVEARYVHPEHVSVGAAVSMMGNHLIDSRTPEFAKTDPKPFTHTWIFGSYDGRITFYEPMVTLAYLKSRPNGCTRIKQPQAWRQAGYYPTVYCIRYSAAHDNYTVSLEGMVRRPGE